MMMMMECKAFLVVLVEVVLSANVCSFGLARLTWVDCFERRWMGTGGQQGACSSLDVYVGLSWWQHSTGKACCVPKEEWTLKLQPSFCFRFC